METNELRNIRMLFGISQISASKILNVPLRSYIRYDNDPNYGDVNKREMYIQKLKKTNDVDQKHGILSIDIIKNIVTSILQNYGNDVSFCYLFGSYAKGYAKEESDVDLCISTSLQGFRFIGLSDKLSIALKKKVDLIRLSDLNTNDDLLKEIMKDGIRIYE